ncbi:MAG: hypothetical protein ABID54_10435 [Pseudomonadota bacterium]
MIPIENETKPIRIIALCSGGLITDVYCNYPAEVSVIDYDTEGMDDDDYEEWEENERRLMHEAQNLNFLRVY